MNAPKHITNVIRINADRHSNPWHVIQQILTECDHQGCGDYTKLSMIRGLAETALANHDRHTTPEERAYEYLNEIVRPKFD